jgi:hypothetical protein
MSILPSLSTKKIASLIAGCLFLLNFQPGRAQTSRHQKHIPAKNLFIDRKLSGRVTITSEWLELTPAEPLKIARDTHELTLFPDPPIPDGTPTAKIEAELIGSDGTTYHSRPGIEQMLSGDLKITSRSLGFKDLPDNVTYTKVRIKSSTPYPVSKILWRCYNWGEVHH